MKYVFLFPFRKPFDQTLLWVAFFCWLTSTAFGQQVLWPKDTPANNGQGLSSDINMVFQRDNTDKATIKFVVLTANNATATSCQVRFRKYALNGSFSTGFLDPRPGSNSLSNGYLNGVVFAGLNNSCQVSFPLDVSSGMYQMEVLINGATATRDFGVGEVFAIAGQSNAAGFAKDNNGEAPTTYPKFVQFNNNKALYDGDDPESVGRKYYRYYWGNLGSQLAAYLNVPVAFYQAAWSGTSVRNWLESSQGQNTTGPGGGLYSTGYPYNNLKDVLQSTKDRVGLRGVLWHQGERGPSQTDSYNYADYLNNLIVKSRSDAGNSSLPWVVSRVSPAPYPVQNDGQVTDFAHLTTAQNRVIGYSNHNTSEGNVYSPVKAYGDNFSSVYGQSYIFTGPNTNDITNRLPDNLHFNVAGQQQVADRFFAALTTPYNGQNFFGNSSGLLNNQTVDVPSASCNSVSCNLSSPVVIGTWNGHTVQLMQFDGNRALVTVVPGGPNGAPKYFARGKNFWYSVTRNANTDQYYDCISVGDTDYGGLVLPFSTAYVPTGYQKGQENDGAIYYYQGNCTPPSLPNLTANPGSVNPYNASTLTATGCPGTVTWSTGQTGTSITVTPATTTTYLAFCTYNGCNSGNSSVTVSVPANPGGGSSACSADNLAGAGNSSENVTYTVNVSSAGAYTVKINYSEWENASGANGSVKINGGTAQPFNASYTGSPDTYQDYSFTANLVAGNNSFQVFGGSSGYIRFRRVCVQGGSSGCNPPAAPGLNASPSSINAGSSSNLTASGCSGTVTWSTGQTGTGITVNPGTTTTYYATCTVGSCTSSNGAVTVTVNSSSGGSCSADNLAGAGNTSENVTYTVNVGSAGTYTVRVNYSQWEGNSVDNARVKVNGGAEYYFNASNTGGPNTYQDYSFTTNLVAGSNSFQIFGGSSGYIRFRRVCVQSGGRLGAADEAAVVDEVEMLSAAPNPNRGTFSVSFSAGVGQPAILTVTDLRGKVWYEKVFTGEGRQTQRIQLAPQATNTLIVSLKVNGRTVSKRVIVSP